MKFQRFKYPLMALLSILLTSTAHAKVFRNAYISFELPQSWNCSLEQTEWVCRSENTKDAKEAIIILTAKEVGPSDSMQQYEAHLNTPIGINLKTGGSAESKIVYKAKTVQINDQPWIDGLHMSSEVQNYFTRYLATIKGRIAVLVTFSAHKQFYTKYSQDFFKAVMSLRVIETKNIGNNPDFGPIRPGSGTFGPGSFQNAMPTDMVNPEDMNGANGKGSDKTLLLAIALILAAAGGYIFLKKRKKK
ncbi:LPXTG cell wall anchor domain-containing protein [Bdellovibrio sp. HCB337]|uniref:LPXTG cell wall anchor domain-containing protein n=1 Tax=Bdellovibrio sp. HCB337 TaxID=3394358 RepID=UPI0039A4130D